MNLTPDFFSTELIGLAVFGYLLGSLSTAIIVCKLMGLPDPRSQGSKNPGATNVLRYGGKKAAAITLLGDALKGFIPVLVAVQFSLAPDQLALVGMAAFLGHLYPVFFGFKGGKGVATAFGVILGLSWIVGLALFATWATMALLFKISSLSAIVAAILAPLLFWSIEGQPIWVAMSIVISLIMLWRHRSNILNLISGAEDKITDTDEPEN